MATKITKEETVTLQDGEELTVRPLNIKNLREFMKVIKKFSQVEDDIDGLDIMLEACQVALRKDHEEISENKEYLEDNLDMDSIAQILRVSGGVDISGDPNLTATG